MGLLKHLGAIALIIIGAIALLSSFLMYAIMPIFFIAGKYGIEAARTSSTISIAILVIGVSMIAAGLYCLRKRN